MSLLDTFVEAEEKHWRAVLVEACDFARRSPDPSTQNSAVLCHNNIPLEQTWAVNEFPRGVEYTDERWERPLKYSVIEHAERNAIYSATYLGIPTVGLTLVSPWAACADCARAIIQGGIDTLVTLSPVVDETNARWDASIDIAMVMLKEAGVRVRYIQRPLGAGFTIRRNGEDFEA